MKNRKLDIGFYRPTDSFKSIPEHIAVMFADDCGLVAVLGASDDDPKNIKETQAYAKLFAAAPDLLAALKAIESHVQPTRDGADEVILNVARAAIAKAEGES